ncbi:MAG: thermonuclease family protein [Coriobacteriia bacterium]|nr:thermonuclease family protein [Coriobacteriia bacterium]
MKNKKILESLLALGIAALLVYFVSLLFPASDAFISQLSSIIDSDTSAQLEQEQPDTSYVDEARPYSIMKVELESIHDGDTIWAHPQAHPEQALNIRLIGIDTPEINLESSKLLGEEAKRALEDLLSSEVLYVEFDEDIRDQYDRTLAYLWSKDPRSVNYDVSYLINLEMVKRGYAKAVYFKPNKKYKNEFFSAMDTAKQEQTGLWAYADLQKLTKK